MATYATLTVPVLDIIGADFNASRASVWIEPNVPVVLADSIRVGGRREQVVNGVATFANLVTTNSADNPASFGYRVTITAPPKGAAGRKDIVNLTTADFPFTATANLKNIPEAWDNIVLPVEWRSAFRDEMEALRDETATISGLTGEDAAVAFLVEDSGSATAGALSATYVPVITPEKYGAVGDGVADDTAAVVSAAAAVTALRVAGLGGNIHHPGATLALRTGSTYKLTTLAAPIVASGNIQAAGASLLAPNAYADTVLLVGHEASGQVLHSAVLDLPNVEKADTTTTMVAGSCAVQVQNLHHSRVKFGRHERFETGWWITGLGQGSVYNSVDPGWVDLCKVAHRLVPRTGGWVNQNTFTGGGVSQSPNTFDGGSTSDKRRAGWRHAVLDGTPGAGTVNANTFTNVSYEGDLSELAIELKNASHNVWNGSTRFEQGTAAVATTLATDTFTTADHGLVVGDMVVFLTTVSRPGGMNTAVPYWVQAVPTSSTFKVAATRGGPAVAFTSNGSGVVFYSPPRIHFDGTGGNGHDNIIQAGYYSYPGPLDIRRINAAKANTIEPSTPRLGDLMPARNRIINGDFRVNQRGYASGAALAVGAFGFDRWKSNQAATTLTFTSTPQGQQVTLDGYIQQVIERAEIPAGTYTLSWDGNCAGRVFRSGDSAPALAAGPITVDLDGTTDIVVEFFGSGQSLGRVQLEQGITATAFEQVPLADQLARCKRYFQRYGAGTANYRELLGVGLANAATAAFFPVRLPVEMRTTPILTVTSSTTFRVNIGTSVIAASSNGVALDATSNRRTLRVNVTVASGLTTGSAATLDTGDGLFDLSAEL